MGSKGVLKINPTQVSFLALETRNDDSNFSSYISSFFSRNRQPSPTLLESQNQDCSGSA